MYQIEVDLFLSAGLGALVLMVGMFIVERTPVLKRFFIPSAVVGGLLSSILMLILYEFADIEFVFDDTVKNVCMNLFFCSVGFMASFSMVKSGGRMLLIISALVGVMIIVQNLVGVATSCAFGMNPGYGLAMGSMSLAGGFGTSAAYGEILVEQHGLTGADVMGAAFATVGLSTAGLIGGPMARRLISGHKLVSTERDPSPTKTESRLIDPEKCLKALIVMCLCVGAGMILDNGFTAIGLTFPAYFGGMILAVIVRNVADRLGYELPIKEIDTLGWLSLCMFLSMALMAIKLWQIAGMGAVMLVTLVIQFAVLILFAYYIVFRATGKNYESVALTSGYVGFMIGATPNAVANVEAIKKEHGPAPVASFVVPLVGGVVLDIINAVVLTVSINLI